MSYTLLEGSNFDLLPTLPDCSVDAIVTDPPYELGFMGKSWDASGIAYSVDLWQECLRVLKHGGHLLAFGGSRTYHRLACAVEDAGFEIRDQIMWVYGSGFPKSLDISKAIDKAVGAEREVIGTRKQRANNKDTSNAPMNASAGEVELLTAPATDEAKQWSGWGTALKPAHEPIVVARKPLDGTVANNVLKHGVGGFNIDGCRVGTEGGTTGAGARVFGNGLNGTFGKPVEGLGRFPANFIHDGSEEATELLGEAHRFFYCAKASKAERNAGLQHMEERQIRTTYDKRIRDKHGSDAGHSRQNFHPTVKPIALMRYLIRLVTPPNGTVLDPFAGSGTTLVAAIQEGMQPIGIELTADYWQIIHARCEHATSEPIQPELFDR